MELKVELNEQLLRFLQILRKIETLELFPAASSLSKAEFRLVREIVLEGEQGKEIISSELARRLGITRSAVSQLVDKMERRGIVKRTASPTDRKIAYIRLSDQVIATFKTQCEQANQFMKTIASEFGEEKLRAFFDSCDEFSAIFEKVRNNMIKQKN